jgi:hypothetical protein
MAWEESMTLLFHILFLIVSVVFLTIAFLTPYDRLTKSCILIHTVSATLNLVIIYKEIGIDQL